MRVIKCGEGFSDVVKCHSCESEIEFYRRDVKTIDGWAQTEFGETKYDVGVLDRYIECPVCANTIHLEPNYLFLPVPKDCDTSIRPQLKGWFS